MAFRALATTCVWACLFVPGAFGQTAPALPASMIAETGQTKSNSLTSGQRSTLTISTSSSIGTSVNISATDGYTSQVQSSLTPLTGAFSSSFGGQTGIIKANITNLQDSTGSGYTATGDGLQVNGSKESQASGSVTVEGINANVNTTLDPTRTSLNASASPTSGAGKSVTTAAGVGNSNASGSISMNNGMNVDVSNTTFSNAFSQAF
jgi:hypothetical protein